MKDYREGIVAPDDMVKLCATKYIQKDNDIKCS